MACYHAPTLFDGARMRTNVSLCVEGGRITALEPGARGETLNGLVAPGFVDWQVNGGGGQMLNTSPSVEGLRAIAAAHVARGTTGFMATVITDAAEVHDAAAQAVAEALELGVPGLIGLHAEGPHLSPDKAGIHPQAHIRPLEASDMARLTRADLGRVLVTLAPECVNADAIRTLSEAGVIVSLGHSNATFEEAMAGFDAGASAVTHLFNAMSGLDHREPGLAAAALARPEIVIGLIADGHHVHPEMIKLALRANPKARLTLVSDAMQSVGDNADGFALNGRTITRQGGRLTDETGRLAGADIDMAGSVRMLVERCDVPLTDALAMATSAPAEFLRLPDRGRLAPGARADMVVLDDALAVQRVFLAGEAVA